jgi:hypothetical protein
MKAKLVHSVSPTSVRFVLSPAVNAKVQREMLDHLPRVMRKTLRITTPKAQPITKTPIDTDQLVSDWLAIHDPLNESQYYCTNTVDPDFDITSHQEFGDIDDEYEGLSIVRMGKDTRRWLKGYNIL